MTITRRVAGDLPTAVCPHKENSRLVLVFVFGIVGVLALVGAGVLYYLGPPDDRD